MDTVERTPPKKVMYQYKTLEEAGGWKGGMTQEEFCGEIRTTSSAEAFQGADLPGESSAARACHHSS